VFDPAAVAKIFEAKRRPADNPLIAHIADFGDVVLLARHLPAVALAFIDEFFPGPLTIVFDKKQEVPTIATAGLDTVGVRMPRFELANRFLTACGVPVVAPSANLSGRPSPTTWDAVLEDLDGRIDCILQGDPTEIGIESTVVDCTGEVPILLRAGAVTLEDLRRIVADSRGFSAADIETERSPGLRHTHYSPKARVVIAECGVRSAECGEENKSLPVVKDRTAFIGLHRMGDPYEIERVWSSVDEYAHSVFEFFRECDRRGIGVIVCEAVEESGIGVALMDRLRRASAG
jgi:L-threonylcarbamoyladenylate synthase